MGNIGKTVPDSLITVKNINVVQISLFFIKVRSTKLGGGGVIGVALDVWPAVRISFPEHIAEILEGISFILHPHIP